MPSKRSLSTSDQEHLRLLKALRESEILRELSELLASSLDPTHILQVLVQRVTEVCDVDRCAVWLLDTPHETFLPSAFHIASLNLKGKELQAAEHIWRRSSLPFNHPIIEQLLQKQGVLIVEDLHTERSMRQLADKFVVRSLLLIALLREGRPVGMMSLDNIGKASTFTEEQQQLARAIGQQAAVAIDNAQLYQQAQEERRRTERLIERAQSIYHVALAVSSHKNLSTVLEIAAQHLVRGLHADGASIALIEGDTLSIVRTTKLPPLDSSAAESYVIPSLHDLTFCSKAAQDRVPLFVRAEQVHGIEKLWYRQIGLSNILIIPLLAGTISDQAANTSESSITHAIHCIGFAFITYQHYQFQPSAGQRAFAQDIAAQCALAIEKAKLLAETRRVASLATARANTLDAVFNAMTEGIIVLDLEGNIILSNNTASHIIGSSLHPGDPLGTYLQHHPIYSLRGQPMPLEGFPLMRALRGEYIRGERFMTKRADDSERLIEVNVAPMLDSEATKIGIVSAFRDITEQVRIERRIRRALDTMLHAAEAISGITDIKDIMYRVLSMTLAAINSELGIVLLYDQEHESFSPLLSIGLAADTETQWIADQQFWLMPEEEHYMSIRQQLLDGHAALISAEQCPDQNDVLYHTMILAAPITYNHQLLGAMVLDRSSTVRREMTPHHPGSTHPLPKQAFNLWDIAVVEGIAQFAGLAIEQTHWQQEAEIARTNEATMRASNALKDEFLAITAHEFRTPLTIILAHSQMIERILKRITGIDQKWSEKLQDSLDNIELQTHQLTNIVNTFLEVTRLNRGQIVLTTEPLDLEDIVKQAVESYRPTSTQHQISYSIQPGTQPYLVMGDKARLLQVFANLLQNAIKYSPLGGPITITMRQYSDDSQQVNAEVCVADKGIGVPQEAQAHLFESFYRAPNVEGSQTRGIGLGLYVVSEFLRLHGGTIRIESSGIPGEGSRFIFTLPLVKQNNTEQEGQ